MIDAREVVYPADGLEMRGRLARPEGPGPWPVVLVGHEGPGLNEFSARRADALAEHGYLALALDIHGGRWFTDPTEMMARLEPLLADPERMRAIGSAALDVALAEPGADPGRVAAIGHGTGGTIALELARAGADLRAVAAVNPWLYSERPQDAANITGAVLVCVGSEDPIVDAGQRAAYQAEMEAAGVDWRLDVYGGAYHAFHHPPVDLDGSLAATDDVQPPDVSGVGYHALHAARAWRDVLDLLTEAFGPVA